MKINFNSSEIEINNSNISYAEICKLAGYSPDTILSITYSRGRNKENGMVTKGQLIELSDRISINAFLTNNA